jgi:CelD/BcsL family acetyltransferase involved in cellulose biosynthesis
MNVTAQVIAGKAQSLNPRILQSPADIRSLTEWIDIYGRCPGATPFQRPEWLLAWIEAFAPCELFAIEVRDRQRLVGLALLLIYPRDDQRVLAFAGGGVSDYLGMLCEAGREADVLQAVIGAVQAEWNVLELTDLHVNSEILNLSSLEPYICEHDLCSVLDLPMTHHELLHMFSKRQRANLRNARSRLEHAGGGTIETATQDNLSEFLDDLFRLHTSRWSRSGEPGVLHDECVRQFHRFCAPALHAQGILKLHRMRVNQHTAAILYSLWERDTVFCYLQGFDPEYATLSPGTQLMFAVMREAADGGMRKFDFLRGQEAYKQHWRPHLSPTFRIALRNDQLTRFICNT